MSSIHASLLRRVSLFFVCVLAARPGAEAAAPLSITNWDYSPAGLRLEWSDQGAGTNYTVLARDTLAESLWLMPPETTCWPIPGNQWLDPRGAASSQRFYRVLATPAAQRGRVLSQSFTTTYTAGTLAALFAWRGIPITPLHDVQLHKITYETLSPWGARVTASGALCLPLGAGGALPLFSYQHGTLTRTNEAPSSMDPLGEVMIGVAFACTGYAAVVPDYLGLGDSAGLHPYHHARSEATAALDLMRAARAFCASNGFALSNRVFLAGYSQGGHATMALLREIEFFHTNEFAVAACAPMAGAYDLSGATAADFLSGRPQPNPYYFAYLVAAYQDTYRLAPSLAELLDSPYDATLPPLLLGNHGGSDINAAMPTNPPNPTLILKPAYLAAFLNNPNHPFRQALRDNDLIHWTPRAPLRLYHCGGDQDVPIANSQTALESFHSRGATQVQLIDLLPGGDHGDCVQPSLLHAKAWFDSLR